LELHKFLSVDGVAIFEIDPGYVKPLENIFNGSGLEILNVYKDFDGNDRAIEVIVKKLDNENRLLTDLK
jgi:methylase of polypeptide subunit release factors